MRMLTWKRGLKGNRNAIWSAFNVKIKLNSGEFPLEVFKAKNFQKVVFINKKFVKFQKNDLILYLFFSQSNA